MKTDYIRDYQDFLKEVHEPFIHPLADVKCQQNWSEYQNLAI